MLRLLGVVLALILSTVVCSPGGAQPAPSPDSGTVTHTVSNGTLVIVGGGSTKAIHRRFVELAGGDDAEVVCVPTALPMSKLTGWCQRLFQRAKVSRKQSTILHTRKRKKADSEAFVEPLKTADAVWFTGGRQWRLVEAYAGTKAEEEFRNVLERGGVIGGSSAGASIQGSFLLRGDPKSKKIVVGEYTEGFGYLPNSAIDQHVLARDRTYDLIPVIEERPRLLGLGVDEQAAAIVHGDTLRVMGKSNVMIYDARRWQQADTELSNDEKVLFLEPGERFDLNTRTVLPRSKTPGKDPE